MRRLIKKAEYIHCHNCHFSQDDFWHKGYNPLKFLYDNYEDDLLSGDLDKPIKGNTDMTMRELIIDELERTIKNIKNMKYVNNEELNNNNPQNKCPKCGNPLCVD